MLNDRKSEPIASFRVARTADKLRVTSAFLSSCLP